MMMRTEHEITVVIADDHPLIRQGLRQVIELQKGLSILAEASDGAMALAALARHRPAVAVLDIDMPERNGFAIAREVRERSLPTRLIFLTMYQEEDALNRALDLGVRGYVLKDSVVTDIVNAIRAVAHGASFISPSLSSHLLQRGNRAPQPSSPVESLTTAERHIMRLVAAGRSTKEIADELCISPRTVDKHRANICEKLDLHGSHALLKFAFKHETEF